METIGKGQSESLTTALADFPLLTELDSFKWSFKGCDDAGRRAVRHGEINDQTPEEVLHVPVVRIFCSEPNQVDTLRPFAHKVPAYLTLKFD
jgi:hypothetical protein